ncbi:hypothetical protein [Loigolactobacillus zhaoyuanensis]|uniref:TPR repeat-containing protein n=1 Tax=Loigolactobacillus zhaoyuanensis TaxID=2486017 RepID=A0ABW8U8H8_9LACO|nr:hypothetical protein [Loigolactobacillus zhaoyuanensis]
MGEQIPFPQNFQRFVQLGQEASAKKQWATAISHLQAAYELEQTFTVNVLLVTALVADEQYQQAAGLAQEKAADYLASAKDCALYLETLMQTHNFIGIRKICQLQPASLPVTAWQQQLEQVKAAEILYRQQAQQQITELQKALYQLSAVPIYEQLNLAKRAQYLPQKEFVNASQRLLTDLYVHPLLRANFLDELRQLGMTTPVDYLWLDETVQAVIPIKLAAITEVASIKAMQQQFSSQSVTDPMISQSISGELALHAAYLYPYADRVITQPKLWAAVYLAIYSDNSVGLSSFAAADVANIKHWQQQFNQLTQRLSM